MTVWVMIVLVVVAITLVVVNLSGSKELFATRISGIWTNADRSLRIVIYDVDSVFKADIVWVKAGLDTLLGKSLIKNLKLDSRYMGVGTYLCPFTHRVLSVRLKLIDSEKMKLFINDEQNSLNLTEDWIQVKG